MINRIWVADEIWELRPDYQVLILTAEGLTGGPSDDRSGGWLTPAHPCRWRRVVRHQRARRAGDRERRQRRGRLARRHWRDVPPLELAAVPADADHAGHGERVLRARAARPLPLAAAARRRCRPHRPPQGDRARRTHRGTCHRARGATSGTRVTPLILNGRRWVAHASPASARRRSVIHRFAFPGTAQLDKTRESAVGQSPQGGWVL